MRFTNRTEANRFYRDFLSDAEREGTVKEAMRELGRRDLFFLLVHLLNRKDADKDWLFDRCQEVRTSPNNHLDLWAREHYKSTIITFALSIQDILIDPDITIGLFSINRPLAKDFLQQIKWEFEENKELIELYDDVLWENPRRQAPIWSLDNGLVVKRQSNPREATIEANGLVDAMPTGKHYKIRLYDDMIDERNCTNPDMIKKSIQAWELSMNLGSVQPTKCYNEVNIARYVGTRYHMNDPYGEIVRRGTAKPRVYPGTKDGTVEGEPVLISRELMDQKRRDMGPYIFGCQILQDPKADEVQGFKQEWLKFWKPRSGGLNIYILCDPASEKKRDSDYTVFSVIGLGSDKNYYVVDMVRDRLRLTERANVLFDLHRKYSPIKVGYEKYGMQADIEHMQDRMERETYRFEIVELGGSMPKNDRIRRLIPLFEQGRFYIPEWLTYVNTERKPVNLTQDFIDDEYTPFPVGKHDDMLDCMARILDPDMNIIFPSASGGGFTPNRTGRARRA